MASPIMTDKEIDMTLNDIIRRDLGLCGQGKEMDAVQRELDEYEREIKRRLWRRRIKLAWTYFSAAIIGAIGAFILGVAKALITNFS